MSKTYADCPQDIRDVAAHIVANYAFDDAVLEGAITSALDSERSKAEWLPISTAPQDGKEILVCDQASGLRPVYVAFWIEGIGWAIWSDESGIRICAPTHWMLLPLLPGDEPTPPTNTEGETK